MGILSFLAASFIAILPVARALLVIAACAAVSLFCRFKIICCRAPILSLEVSLNRAKIADAIDGSIPRPAVGSCAYTVDAFAIISAKVFRILVVVASGLFLIVELPTSSTIGFETAFKVLLARFLTVSIALDRILFAVLAVTS